MSDTAKPAASWQRFLFAGLLFLALILVLGYGVFAWMQNLAGSRTRDTLSQLNADDPGWELEELMASLPAIPPTEDSALRIVAIVRALPSGWLDYKKIEDWGDLSPHLAFDETRLATLDKLLAGVGPQVKAARELIKFPRGRHRLVLERNPLETLLPDHQETRSLATLLDLDSRERALRGDARQALLDARAMLAMSNVFDHDPFLVSALIGLAFQSIAMSSAERTLALGEASDADLEAFGKALDPYVQKTRLVFAMRGERAVIHRVVQLLIAGEISPTDLTGTSPSKRPWWGWFADVYLKERARGDHPELLRVLTRMVEIAKLPSDMQTDAEQKLDKEIKASKGIIVRMLTPASTKLGQAGRRLLAQARAMQAAVAVERYRMKHGKWPTRLDDAMSKVPLDPLDARPLRYARWADGVVIYSIGQDGKDDGGDVATPARKDFGYRLWDVAKRKQPAPPAKKAGP